MSEQETLRMAAEIVDKFSGPLKKMVVGLRDMHRQGEVMNTRGAKEAAKHALRYKQLTESVLAFKTKGLDAVVPAMGAFSIEAMGVAGAVVAVGAAVAKTSFDWAAWGRQLTWTSRQSGLASGTVNGLVDANKRLGISAEQTNQALDAFGGHMNQLNRRSPIYLNQWKQYPRLWNELGQSLMAGGLSRDQQLHRAMNFIPKIRDPDQRKRVLALLGLPENWANLTAKEMGELEAQAERFSRRHPFNARDAEKAAKAYAELGSEIRGIENDLSNWTGSKLFDAAQWIAAQKATHDFLSDTRDLAKDIAQTIGKWDLSSEFKKDMVTLDATMKELKWTFDLAKNGPGDKNSWWNRPVFSGKNSLWNEFLGEQANKDAVKEGVKEGLQDYFNTMTDAQRFAGGYMPMAYHPTETIPRFGSADFPVSHVGVERLRQRLSGTALGPSPVGGRAPASIRYNNPGAQWPRAGDQRFGAVGYGRLADGNLIERFKDPSEGAAANMALFNDRYTGMTIGAAGRKWTGQHSFGVPGYDPNMIVTRAMMRDPKFVIPFFRAIARREAGRQSPLTDQQWTRGFELFQAGGLREFAEKHGAKLRDHVTRGTSSPSAPLPDKRSDATGLRNSLDVKIGLDGFPRGTRFAQNANGPMFRQVTLNRGKPMATGSETS